MNAICLGNRALSSFFSKTNFFGFVGNRNVNLEKKTTELGIRNMSKEPIIQKPIKRLLTGDTPTGKLHLGHWVGSLENRVKIQETGEYECFFILANCHAFSTKANDPKSIRTSLEDVTIDMLAAGIDPKKSSIFIQSEVPAIAELTFFFSMLLPHAQVLRNPTLKQEIRDKKLQSNYPFGFFLYPVGQVADILAFKPEVVPVGEDQVPHLELAREVARRFNQSYCGIGEGVPDEEHLAKGGLLPIIKPLIGRVNRLVGYTGPDENGRLKKMGKSSNNAILLSDSSDEIKEKIMKKMYTDPNRIRVSDPGRTDNNPLWIYHDAFNKDVAWVQEAKDRYQKGQIGDVECKKKLVEAIIAFTEPMRIKRAYYEKNRDEISDILKQGTRNANEVAEKTLDEVKAAMHQDFFKRKIDIH
jgi:tryptophanyl-tRNA synthetase